MSITTQQSQYISATRLFMVFGLVFNHLFRLPKDGIHPRDGLFEVNMLLPDAINSWVHMAFMASVPLLSIISGFLFFNDNKFNYSYVIKKKFKTVMLPSWTWCLLWLTFAAVIFYISNGKYFSGGDYNLNEFSLLMGLNGIFGLTYDPFAIQFWFVHDLILTFLLFPVIKYCLDRQPYLFLAALATFWFSQVEPFIFFRTDVLFFFVLGGVIARYDHLYIFKKANKPIVKILVPLVFLTVLTLRAWTYLFFDIESSIAKYIQSDFSLSILRLLGVIAFSIWLSWAQRHLKYFFSFFVKYSSYSFLVFALHYPLINIVQTIVEKTITLNSATSLLIAWIMIPTLTIGLCLIFSFIAKKTLPGITSFLAGQRLT